jgi:hypothetical protein
MKENDQGVKEDFLVSLLKLRRVVDKTEMLKLHVHLTSCIGEGIYNFPGYMPSTFTPEVAVSVDRVAHLYARKWDGMRAFVVTFESKTYMVFRSLNVYECPVITSSVDDAIYEMEIVHGDTGLRMIVFDVVYFGGARLDVFVTARYNALLKIVKTVTSSVGTVEMQRYYNYRTLCTSITDEWEGVIIVKSHSCWGTFQYKWKEPESLTIDLFVHEGRAYSRDNEVVFTDVEVEEGTWEFSLRGKPIRPRSKLPNFSFVVHQSFRSSQFTFEKFRKAMEEKEIDECAFTETKVLMAKKPLTGNPVDPASRIPKTMPEVCDFQIAHSDVLDMSNEVMFVPRVNIRRDTEFDAIKPVFDVSPIDVDKAVVECEFVGRDRVRRNIVSRGAGPFRIKHLENKKVRALRRRQNKRRRVHEGRPPIRGRIRRHEKAWVSIDDKDLRVSRDPVPRNRSRKRGVRSRVFSHDKG